MTEGGCLCGAVRWAYSGAPLWVVHCHCESCRRQCAAPVVTFVGVSLDAFRWTGVPPASYASSQGVTRRFCATCGTPVSFEAGRYPGEIHVYACGHDRPEALVPTGHVHHEERLAWLRLSDDLPRHPGFG